MKILSNEQRKHLLIIIRYVLIGFMIFSLVMIIFISKKVGDQLAYAFTLPINYYGIKEVNRKIKQADNHIKDV